MHCDEIITKKHSWRYKITIDTVAHEPEWDTLVVSLVDSQFSW